MVEILEAEWAPKNHPKVVCFQSSGGPSEWGMAVDLVTNCPVFLSIHSSKLLNDSVALCDESIEQPTREA